MMAAKNIKDKYKKLRFGQEKMDNKKDFKKQ